MARLDLYIDFISPYAYLAWKRLPELLDKHDNVELTVHPILFAALLNHNGQLGPAEIPSKRRATFEDVWRLARYHDIPMIGPATHPFNTLHALRCAVAEPASIDVLFDAGWGRGIEMGDPESLATALSEAGLDGPGILGRTRERVVKDQLRANTEAALARGVFGVPTFDVDGQLFWGSDRMHLVDLALGGTDLIEDREALETALARPSSAQRPR